MLALIVTLNERNLIVAPPGVSTNWTAEIQKHTKNCKFLEFKTVKQAAKFRFAANIHNIYIISHSILRMTFSSYPSADLFKFNFFRCILDEGHLICQVQTKLFKSTSALKSTYRWIMSGIVINFKTITSVSNSLSKQTKTGYVNFVEVDWWRSSQL